METEGLKAFFRSQLEETLVGYLKDFDALTHEQLDVSPGGKARTAYDFSYEIAVLNERFAKRMQGIDPGDWPFEGWVVAPTDHRSKDRMREAIANSNDSLLKAWDELPAAEMFRPIATKTGETNPLQLASFASIHTSYHDAQLNYLQALHGDDQMHQ